jgi:hypothetical protein
VSNRRLLDVRDEDEDEDVDEDVDDELVLRGGSKSD